MMHFVYVYTYTYVKEFYVTIKGKGGRLQSFIVMSLCF